MAFCQQFAPKEAVIIAFTLYVPAPLIADRIVLFILSVSFFLGKERLIFTPECETH